MTPVMLWNQLSKTVNTEPDGVSQTGKELWEMANPPYCFCFLFFCLDYALGKDCIMHGYMLKLGNPFLTQWQRRYFYLFPNRVEWRGEGESRVSMQFSRAATNVLLIIC